MTSITWINATVLFLLNFRNSLLQNKSVIFCKCGVRVDTEVSEQTSVLIVTFYLFTDLLIM